MTQETTLSRALAPSQSLLLQVGLILVGSWAVGLGAQIDVPMVPVPMSLQTFAISIIGLTYGSRLATSTLVAYLVQGAAGLPLFAGGASGLAHLYGPTAGYLFGFVGMAWLTGWMVEHGFGRGLVRLFIASLAPAAVLFVPGVAWLWAATPLDLPGAINAGFTPFTLGLLVKSAVAALVVHGAWSALAKRSH